jgi:DNA/RNA-binding domain of Phe-tRNA-synthetase-like protein
LHRPDGGKTSIHNLFREMRRNMEKPPFEVIKEAQGWLLFWARLELIPGGLDQLSSLRAEVARKARARLTIENLSADPTVAGLRKLFRAAGCDPTRYRPASEALLRRVLKGEELPALHPFVDINNCLSVELAVPCCMMREGSFVPPLVMRSGRAGEGYESLRGPFNLEGKPLLTDTLGPLDSPITGNERVKITPEDDKAWLVAYLPEQTLTAETARDTLMRLLDAAPVARASCISAS